MVARGRSASGPDLREGTNSPAGEPRWNQMATELYERLEERRARFERDVLARFGGVFGEADAEDLVGKALDRVLATGTRPDPGKEEAWFRVLVGNAAIDEIRHRYGRGHSAKSRGALREVVLLSELTERGIDIPGATDDASPDGWMDRLADEDHRHRVIALARFAADQLTQEELRILVARHVEMPDATYQECAEAAGQSVSAWRYSYRRAWKRFVACVAATEQTPHCRPTRELLGSFSAGTLDGDELYGARASIELHVVDCPACRAFARDSYRVLELVPAGPAGGLGLQQCVDRATQALDRGPAEVAAGATAGGVGLLAWLTAGGMTGAVKMLAVICGLSVTTAGICGGVLATLDYLRDAPASRAAAPKPEEPRRKPVAAVTATAVPSPVPTRPPARTTSQRRSRPARSSRWPEKASPAAVPTGSTGNEFDPIPEDSQPQPAPVSVGVTGEFAP